jgi:hypothetical protein
MFAFCNVARFKIHVPKANPGEYFPDLDLQTKLLAPTGGTSARQPVIEVLGLFCFAAQFHSVS